MGYDDEEEDILLFSYGKVLLQLQKLISLMALDKN